MKKYLLLLGICAVYCSCRPSKELTPSQAINKLGKNPYIVIDGTPANNAMVNATNEEDVASLTTYYGKEAIEKYGKQARDGAVIVETKLFSKAKFQKVFSLHNPEYKTRLSTEGNDNKFLYVLNGKVLSKDFEGELAGIAPDLLQELKIIEKEEVVRRFNINDKVVGVIITMKLPAGVKSK